MELFIDTTQNNEIIVALKERDTIINEIRITAPKKQSELLLKSIEDIFAKTGFDIKSIKKIRVENSGGSFTSLRIGVATSNALGYALGIPVIGVKPNRGKIVKALYSRGPDIK